MIEYILMARTNLRKRVIHWYIVLWVYTTEVLLVPQCWFSITSIIRQTWFITRYIISTIRLFLLSGDRQYNYILPFFPNVSQNVIRKGQTKISEREGKTAVNSLSLYLSTLGTRVVSQRRVKLVSPLDLKV